MPERRFDTAYWNEPFIMELPLKAKLLYIYLWTNIHCNQAGLYQIAIKTISFEIGLTVEEIPEIMKLLEKKVVWLPDQSLVWVKNFLHRQTKSPTFLTAAAKCLESINDNGLVKEFIAYNEGYSLSIPYREGMDRVEVSPPSSSLSYANTSSLPSSDEGVVRGNDEVTLSQVDEAIIVIWQSVKGFTMEMPAIVELLATLRKDFPDVDILDESRKWAARKISEPLTLKSRPSGQIYNFIAKRHDWNEEKKGGRGKRNTDPDKYVKGKYGHLTHR